MNEPMVFAILTGIASDEAENLNKLCTLYDQGMVTREMLGLHLGRAEMLNEVIRILRGAIEHGKH